MLVTGKYSKYDKKIRKNEPVFEYVSYYSFFG
jgi:hypothetical protein